MFCFLRNLLPALFLPGLLVAQPGMRSSILVDDPIAARLDDLAAMPWVRHSPLHADTARLNIHGFPAHYIPTWPETTYQSRLAALDGQTPFDLTYNPVVRSFIDLYGVRKREMTSRMLGLADLYFPIFEEYLDKHRLPLELKYLAVVESALNPAARSKASAVGLWQFMLTTGRIYGLDATSYIDERHDVHKSTEAACLYLKHLHGLYDDWELALAAYNCGPGNVNKAIRRSGGAKEYWKIYDHLPLETRGYVPAFIAVNYMFAYAADHNLYPVIPTYCGHQLDTVQVCYPLDISSIARLTGSPEQELRDLNPTFKLGIVPDLEEPVTLYLPKRSAGVFVTHEDSLRYALFRAAPQQQPTPTQTTEPAASKPRFHTVRRGESLGVIAGRYHISIAELKKMNGLRGSTIRAGQKLKVGRSSKPTATRAPQEPVRTTDRYIYYEVQPGDTLINIAERYPGTTVDDLRRMNGDIGDQGLTPGQRIKVGLQQG